LDWEGEAGSAGAAHPHRRRFQVLSRQASCFGERHFDNRLVFGDNLLALKAVEQEFAGKIKEVRHTVVTALTLETKLAAQKRIRALEGTRNKPLFTIRWTLTP
jgi:hypothetical protein